MAQDNDLVVHIGLGKTATTTLQRHVFPELARMTGHAYNPDQIQGKAYLQHLAPNLDQERAQISQVLSKGATFISNEGLVGWQPNEWEEHADKNLELFGRHATILLTMRDPVQFQTSLFLEMFKQFEQLDPRRFFLNRREFDYLQSFRCKGFLEYFDVDGFDLERLYNLYVARFDRVHVQVLEDLPQMNAVARAFGLQEADHRVLCDLLAAAPRENSGLSSFAVQLGAWRGRVWPWAGGELAKGRARQRVLAAFREGFVLGPALAERRFRDMSFEEKIRALPGRLVRRLDWLLTWRGFQRKIVMRFGPQQKYSLPADVYSNPDLDRRNRDFLDRVRQAQQAGVPIGRPTDNGEG